VKTWLFRTGQVAECDGIILSDLRKTPGSEFRNVLLCALKLLKEIDPYRYRRVQRRIQWIVCTTLSKAGSAEYRHNTKSCEMEFIEPSADYDLEWLIGWYACVLVHEATHGKIKSRGVAYSKKWRLRIEELCVLEEHKFLMHMAITRPGLASRFDAKFVAAKWRWHWDTPQREQILIQLRRSLFPEKGHNKSRQAGSGASTVPDPPKRPGAATL